MSLETMKLSKRVGQCIQPERRSWFGNLRVKSGYANLPIGALLDAIQENGVRRIAALERSLSATVNQRAEASFHITENIGGADETRTRNLLPDRHWT
jgi:hypothetical protein